MAKPNPMIMVTIPEEAFPFSEDFLSFIYQDEMGGIFDLFEMTKNVNAAKRIPPRIRDEYEHHYMTAGKILDRTKAELHEKLETIQASKKSDDSEIFSDCMNVFVEKNGITITNMLPTEFVESLENSIQRFEDDYNSRPQEMKIHIIHSAIVQFVEKHVSEAN